MPKKARGENSKAVEARARKAEAQAVAAAKKQKEIEDEFWKDDDKHINRKMQRKVSFTSKNLLHICFLFMVEGELCFECLLVLMNKIFFFAYTPVVDFISNLLKH